MSKVVGWMCLGIMLLPGMVQAADWTEKVMLKGDLRYRHESFSIEDRDARHRHRIRARIGIEAKPGDGIKLGIQLASGSDDPVSTNQDLDGGFTTKDIRLDLAYVDLHSTKIPGLHIIAGKMNNPFHKPVGSELIWDSDINPEGGALKYGASYGSVEFFSNIGGFWVEERESDRDTWLFGGQAGVDFSFPDDSGNVGFGFSFFKYGNTAGFGPIYDDDPFGNTLDEDGNYMYDYDIVEFFAEIGFNPGNVPVSFFVDYARNVSSGVVYNQGWLVGAAIGKTRDPGSWAFRYNYRDAEADAVFGTYNDSDFISGGTDGRGSEFNFDFQIAKAWQAGATYFLNERRLTSGGEDYHRIMLDLQFKF